MVNAAIGGKARLGSVFPEVAVFKLGFKESRKTRESVPFVLRRKEAGRCSVIFLVDLVLTGSFHSLIPAFI